MHQSPPLAPLPPLLPPTSISSYFRLPYGPISDVSSSAILIGLSVSISTPSRAVGRGGFAVNMLLVLTFVYDEYVGGDWVVKV